MTSSAPYELPEPTLPDLFTTEEAYAAGLSKRDLASGRYRRVFRGGYARTGAAPSFAHELAFALRVVPTAQFATQYSAARLFGGTTPLASNLHLGTLVRHKCTLDGIRLHFYKNPPEVTLIKGIRTTPPGQTFLDLARSLEFADLLVLGDSFARQPGCTPSYLQNFVADVSTHGAQHAREVAALIRGHVRSPNESRLRLLIISGGLPEPAVNLVVYNERRTKKREIDLALKEWKIAIEFDGRHHIERVHQWENDIMRREELEAMGWRFVVITSSALYGEPLRILQRIVDAVTLAGGPRLPIKDDWRRHFG